MGVLHSIPLCSRGNEVRVEPLDLDKNNNEASVVYTSQPHAIVASVPVPPPEATSTPRPQSPTGLENEQYSDSSQWVLSSVLEFVNLSLGLEKNFFTVIFEGICRLFNKF